jgi:hypothetical protein
MNKLSEKELQKMIKEEIEKISNSYDPFLEIEKIIKALDLQEEKLIEAFDYEEPDEMWPFRDDDILRVDEAKFHFMKLRGLLIDLLKRKRK